MRFSFDKTLGVHEQSVTLRAKRTELLATNLANADTPNYKARDIDFRDILAGKLADSQAGKLTTTNGSHISTEMNSIGGLPIKYRIPEQPSLDGNTVDVQAERAEFMKNSLQYQASVMFLDRRFKGLISAFRGE